MPQIMRYCPGTKWAAEIGVPKIELEIIISKLKVKWKVLLTNETTILYVKVCTCGDFN